MSDTSDSIDYATITSREQLKEAFLAFLCDDLGYADADILHNRLLLEEPLQPIYDEAFQEYVLFLAVAEKIGEQENESPSVPLSLIESPLRKAVKRKVWAPWLAGATCVFLAFGIGFRVGLLERPMPQEMAGFAKDTEITQEAEERTLNNQVSINETKLQKGFREKLALVSLQHRDATENIDAPIVISNVKINRDLLHLSLYLEPDPKIMQDISNKYNNDELWDYLFSFDINNQSEIPSENSLFNAMNAVIAKVAQSSELAKPEFEKLKNATKTIFIFAVLKRATNKDVGDQLIIASLWSLAEISNKGNRYGNTLAYQVILLNDVLSMVASDDRKEIELALTDRLNVYELKIERGQKLIQRIRADLKAN